MEDRLAQFRPATATKLLLSLLKIEGPPGKEQEVAQFITDQLVRSGADPKAIVTDSAYKKTLLPGNSGNLIFKLKGNMQGPRRLLMAHMDTVPICVGTTPRQVGDRIVSVNKERGLGGDNRSGCGVILNAALTILKHDLPHPPLTFLWTVQEEVGLQGARCIQRRLLSNPKTGFNWDGQSPSSLIVGATGGYRMDIEITGLASHAGNDPEEGISAIAIAAIAIADLQENGWHGLVRKGKKEGTSNVGVIQGGAATNVVTESVKLRAEARSHDPIFRKRIVREIELAFKRAVKKVKNSRGQIGSVTVDGTLDYESFKIKPSEPCVVMAKKVLQSLGEEPIPKVANGGLDANWMNEHGIPTVTLGCGQREIHTVNETLVVEEYLTACQSALLLATEG
ncbi:MAG: M20/M25/M40 family metallo-hydrolase [Pirellulaceae bacterium]|nr:M20/M25/M40 family metallo-hydrolase [Pirellulaceae bacterium]